MGSRVIIDDLKLTPLPVIKSAKGDIYHALKLSDKDYMGFGEAYFSYIHKGAIKGWKRHNRLTLNIVVPIGEIRFVIYDDRSDSLTYSQFADINLGPLVQYARLTIPIGLWVAFQGIAEINMLMNIIPEAHDPLESDNLDLSKISYFDKSRQ